MYKILETNNERMKIEFNDKNEELKSVLNQSNAYQASNFELALQLKQLEEELLRVGQSKETIESAKAELFEKFNEYGSVIQKECEDRIETVKQQYKDKKEKLVDKIMSQKARIDDFEVQKRDYISHTESIKTKYEETISTLKEDIKKVKKEWESKLYYQELEYQKRITELSSRHKLEINQMQTDIQAAFDEKIQEIETESNNQIQKSNQDVQMFKSALEKLKKECIKIDEHERIIRDEINRQKFEREQEIKEITDNIENELYSKIEQLEGDLEQINNDNLNLEEALKVEKSSVKELSLHLEEKENSSKELIQKINEIISENDDLRDQINGDYKAKLLENKVKELSDALRENEELKGNYLTK